MVKSRIERAFERRFAELLGEVGARQREKGIQWQFSRAKSLAHSKHFSFSRALAEMNIALAEKLHRFRLRRDGPRTGGCPRLFCDAGLGGLARWLRAAGCEALWVQDIADADLVARAEHLGATVVTTDSFLLDRSPIVQGRVRAIWVPPTLTKFEQLRLVRAELDIPDADSRCMHCGGELIEVDKQAVRERVPPKTYRWVDEYFLCTRCGQLFWHGTHWQHVSAKLRRHS